ncbi:hypothetical protein NECAME_10708 [Necator americanus]|uniref:Uncharacterized protein n=1 Tax=Necator americanus TaxID=51031 RepID=W2T8H0_NECAM|nr:hypothetical protein NECAME_10708 [Necator americanus]ETN77924.1 hypothetical protein NECAME_10708 [Necator americanus]
MTRLFINLINQNKNHHSLRIFAYETQRIPCVNVQPLIDASQSGDNESLRRQSSGSSFSNSRSEADSELSKEDREPNATVDSVATLSSSVRCIVYSALYSHRSRSN